MSVTIYILLVAHEGYQIGIRINSTLTESSVCVKIKGELGRKPSHPSTTPKEEKIKTREKNTCPPFIAELLLCIQRLGNYLAITYL